MTFSSAFKAVVMMALISIVNARINYPDKLSDISRRDLSGNLDIECHDCTCFSCTGTTDKGDGTMDVTFGHCKDDPGDSLRWMCCVGYDGGEGNCNVVGPCTPEEGTQKCEDIAAGDVLTVNVPTDTETVSINTHDGRTAAAADMDNAVCGGNGNQGGVCAALDATSHCLIHFAIENCGNTPSPTTSFPTTSPTVPGATTPAPAPTPAQPTWGGSFGDPHIRTWAGEQFDVSCTLLAFCFGLFELQSLLCFSKAHSDVPD
ncbi:expressed unknown protein [Seminavis robusta]|uniref:Uncharacterized protein n=1 Tax=Seminavis robusta TaxID=568900 RepID=A0A9N8DAI1_9STRA|nr:expressed unknown protein [Seminavis robusta]|eukprot:Sro16_g011700.1 n/a (260) ;mRNA; f:77084-77863